MNRELLSKAFSNINESYISEAYRPVLEVTSASPERTVHMKKKHIICFPFAAALILVVGITAYAVWNIHAARQQELKSNLKIEENNVSSYMEYDLSKGQEDSLVLLSSINDGQQQHIYVDISPVSEEEAVSIAREEILFSCSIKGTEIVGNASPKLPSGTALTGKEEIQKAILENAYDKETQTLTLECYMDASHIEEAVTDLEEKNIPLQIDMVILEEQEEKDHRVFGPVLYSPADEQKRYFDFNNVVYRDEELDKQLEIVGLELTPLSAVWKVRYNDAEAVHTQAADIEAYKSWLALEDKICLDAQVVFKDGHTFSTGCVLSSPYVDGIVNLECSWGSTININDVQCIVLDDQVLWDSGSEANSKE